MDPPDFQGKNLRTPPKHQGKNRGTPPKLQGKNQGTPPVNLVPPRAHFHCTVPKEPRYLVLKIIKQII